jgi:hypothetical protein
VATLGYPKGDEDVWNLLCASPRNQYSTAFFHHFLINLFQMAQSMMLVVLTALPPIADFDFQQNLCPSGERRTKLVVR